MKNYTINHKGYTFMRINKTKAKGVYQTGKAIALAPCNMRPFGNVWFQAYVSKLDQYKEMSFNEFVNIYERYNCSHLDSRKYAAFYIPVVESENGYIYDDTYIKGGVK